MTHRHLQALYNIYTQLLQSNIKFLYEDCFSFYGKVLLRLNLHSCLWSFNYLTYFIFYFHKKHRFCSYIFGICKIKQNEVYLTVLLDRNEYFSLEKESDNLFLFLHWLEFNGILVNYYCSEPVLDEEIILKSENICRVLTKKDFSIIKNRTFELSSISLSREPFSYIWFVQFLQDFKNTQHFVFDFFNNSRNQCRDLQFWSDDLCFLLDKSCYNFYYYTNAHFNSIYQNPDFKEHESGIIFDVFFESIRFNHGFSEEKEINFVPTLEYLQWFLFSKTSLIPLHLSSLFDVMVCFSLTFLFFCVSYTHLTVCGPIIQKWFLYSFPLLKGLEFVLLFQTEKNLKKNELSFYFLVNKDFKFQDLEQLVLYKFGLKFTSYTNKIKKTKNINSCVWSYRNRILAGNYSTNWCLYNKLVMVFTQDVINLDRVYSYKYSTILLGNHYYPNLTDYELDYQNSKNFYLVTRKFSVGIL